MQLLLQYNQLINSNESVSQRIKGLVNKFNNSSKLSSEEEELKKVALKILQLHQQEIDQLDKLKRLNNEK